ncbi:hypothetical protein [Streptomyces sp. SID3343]|uniref:hypothetical protein n=1 Tax=Streptomyces sp. SID3343 TaxID=2690260 RepID=UPI001368C1D0|nr:hypothetical protein [Streptomyces sp. SID3343]
MQRAVVYLQTVVVEAALGEGGSAVRRLDAIMGLPVEDLSTLARVVADYVGRAVVVTGRGRVPEPASTVGGGVGSGESGGVGGTSLWV